MTYSVNDVVKTTKGFEEASVPEGEAGTIVAVFDTPDRAYEVEFTGSDGEVVATLTLKEGDLEPA